MCLLAQALACGGASQDRVTKVSSPQAPVVIELQDQHFVLEPIRVAATGLASPKTEQVRGALHRIEQLQGIAQSGLRDARACRVQDARAEQGSVVLSLELAATGIVMGGSVMPRGGAHGLGAVADCLLSRARAWNFPSRSIPGSTIVVASYLYGSRSEPMLGAEQRAESTEIEMPPAD